MEIKTKFNLYEEVYFLYDNKLTQSSVAGISLEINTKRIEEKYVLQGSTGYTKFDRSSLFKTKEELVASLINSKRQL